MAGLRNIKFHWWVLIGIALGVLLGSILNGMYEEEVRQQILGDTYTTDQLREKGQELGDALATRIRDTLLGGALYGVSNIFMNLLKMIVIPLVFFSLVMGMAGMGGARSVGRIGLKTAAWYVSTSLLAIVTGLVVVNVIGPGRGSDIIIPTTTREAHPPESFWDVIANMIPSNVFKSMTEFDMFGVIFFAILFGAFMVTLDEKQKAPMLAFMDAGSEIMMRMTSFVISLAPIGIAALVGYTVATSGPEVFLSLIGYVLTVAVALGIHIFLSVPLLIWLLTRRNPYRYLKAMGTVLITAFSTASSAGTLALTMEEARNKAGISNRITSFVLPLGATVNMDGTALYECVTVLFIAQVHASTHPEFAPLTVGAQIMVVFLALAVSIGAAGIPHAGLVMMVIILNAVNLPLEYTALVWAVDRVLDMARTMTNVWSDASGALVIAHTENEIDGSVLFSPNPGHGPTGAPEAQAS